MKNITIVLRKQIVDLSAKDADQLTVEQAVFVHAEYAEVSDGGFIEFLPAGCEGNHQTIISASGHGFSCSGIPVTAVYDRVEFWPSEYAKAEFPSHLEYVFGKSLEADGRFGPKDLSGVTEINFDNLKCGIGTLVTDFVEAVKLLKRPYYPISSKVTLFNS